MGGWTFEPWRGTFFPKGLRQADELEFATRAVTAIEINGTYYSGQKAESWAKWGAAAPDGFVYSMKASRFCTNRKVLAEAWPSIERFFAQGMENLGPKLGPVLWQLANSKKFEPEDFAGFLKLMPREVGGLPLRHVVEPRHPSFVNAEAVGMCRDHGVAICLAEHATYPMIADVTADFVYARLQIGEDENPTAYTDDGIAQWAGRLKTFAQGGAPDDLPRLAAPAPKRDRDVFAFIISGGKVHAPAGAVALQKAIDA